MRNTLRIMALTAIMVGAMADRASANLTFTLSNVGLALGSFAGPSAGSLSGTFTTNDAITQLISVDITTSAATNVSPSFAQQNYTLANSSATFIPTLAQGVQLGLVSNTNFVLNLEFSPNLSSSGGGIWFGTYETQNGVTGGHRVATGTGTVTVAAATVVPEPSTAVAAALGVAPAALVFIRRRRGARQAA